MKHTIEQGGATAAEYRPHNNPPRRPPPFDPNNHPYFKDLRFSSALSVHKAGNFAGSEGLYQELTNARSDEDKCYALLGLGCSLAEQGKWVEGIAATRTCIEIAVRNGGHPELYKAYSNLALQLFELGDLVEARQAIANALKLLPDDEGSLEVARYIGE